MIDLQNFSEKSLENLKWKKLEIFDIGKRNKG